MGKKVFSNLHKAVFYLQKSLIEDERKELYTALDIMHKQLQINQDNNKKSKVNTDLEQ